jgi:hypothetical protein
VDADYITYLLKFDSRVPKVDYSAAGAYEKFLCGIVLNIHGHDYFAPISSFRTPQRTNIIIKDVNGKDVSSIRFSFIYSSRANSHNIFMGMAAGQFI